MGRMRKMAGSPISTGRPSRRCPPVDLALVEHLEAKYNTLTHQLDAESNPGRIAAAIGQSKVIQYLREQYAQQQHNTLESPI